MFSSVLIANRGEIAVRIARTAKRLGLRTIAVYSDVDAGALHVRACDEAYPIGAAAPRESYLNIDKLIEVARAAGAQCIHPGYGFLSENADFAEAALRAGIAFVGPSPAAIRAMGLKDRAKALMEKAGVPVVPGYHGDVQADAFLKRKAYEIGYVGAGTVEFIASAEPRLKSGGFWFMEMNTRLQVEHPVTEATTGFDLVEWQFRVAAGEPLPVRQDEVPLSGHAVEARLYAEDPDRGFLPSPGRIVALDLPHGEGIRVDAGVAAGLTVPPDYDPMIAKVIAHGATREAAL